MLVQPPKDDIWSLLGVSYERANGSETSPACRYYTAGRAISPQARMRNWIVAAQSISQHIAIQPARVLRVVAENFEIEAALGAAVSMALAYNVLSSLIQLPDHREFMMYGNDVMDFTILGLCSM
jgi:hypothetical protein